MEYVISDKCTFVFLLREREEDLFFEAMLKNKGEKFVFFFNSTLKKIGHDYSYLTAHNCDFFPQSSRKKDLKN